MQTNDDAKPVAVCSRSEQLHCIFSPSILQFFFSEKFKENSFKISFIAEFRIELDQYPDHGQETSRDK